jgi:hypothetical protein
MSRDTKKEVLDFLESLDIGTGNGQQVPVSESKPATKPWVGFQPPIPPASQNLPPKATIPFARPPLPSSHSSNISSTGQTHNLRPESATKQFQATSAVNRPPVNPAIPELSLGDKKIDRTNNFSPAGKPGSSTDSHTISTNAETVPASVIAPGPPPPLQGVKQFPIAAKRTGFIPQFNSNQNAPTRTTSNNNTTALNRHVDIPAQSHSENLQNNGWSWSSIVETAAKTLDTAKTMAGTAATTIGANEHLRSVYENVGDLSKLSTVVGNVIAPPLKGAGTAKYSSIVCWCYIGELTTKKVESECRRAVRECLTREVATTDGHGSQSYCSTTEFHLVENETYLPCDNSAAAVRMAETSLEKLQKLAESNHKVFIK